MIKRKTLATRMMAGATVGALITACSSSSSSGGDAGSNNNNPTPPGTTPVANAPYPVCTTLEPGSFTTSNMGSYTEPSTQSCSKAGGPTSGAADMHCVGMPPQTVNGADCSVADAGSTPPAEAGAGDAGSGDAGSGGEDAGPMPTPGPCDENGTDGEYGSTMYGTEGDDDDCKYHVTYTASPICENNGTYFVVKASYLAKAGSPVTGASTFAELCFEGDATHVTPGIDARPPNGKQQVVEGPPGTYTIGPVQFDESGQWTVRFHFNEFCCDVAADSPHGHAAFHITVP